ncbi:Arf-GAP with dual PH domain-containing protein 2 [Heterocephalus glaber]|uniref:Arf-GAP with dual PH domain-containing protein 2 n=1 Tax=Heterocephalus glaber TaxID=10181 RepID=G5BVM4_HETGA|nr:Arf-GAP with dual PH domain-containing protein 2 [Heterocephalus glaber]
MSQRWCGLLARHNLALIAQLRQFLSLLETQLPHLQNGDACTAPGDCLEDSEETFRIHSAYNKRSVKTLLIINDLKGKHPHFSEPSFRIMLPPEGGSDGKKTSTHNCKPESGCSKRKLATSSETGSSFPCFYRLQTDVPASDPDWASYKLGIFICLHCSGVHRNFPEISKVKSVRLDFWDDSIVEFMTHNGNLHVKAKFEASVPAFYYIPQASDCSVLKEQWIRAKYERQEFMADGKPLSSPGNREGILWKRGRDNGQYLRRRFVLLAREGLLKYYTKEQGKGPKAVISIKDLNATFQTEKIGHPHGLQITYGRESHTRNLFLYHESGKEIVDWFNALRAARLQYLKMAFPDLPEAEAQGRKESAAPVVSSTKAEVRTLEVTLVPLITRNYLKQGFMEKTGPKEGKADAIVGQSLDAELRRAGSKSEVWLEGVLQREPFKKRWFALDPQERRLLYYKNPLDAFEQGQVFLGSKEQGYEVLEELPKGVRGSRWKAGLTIVTPHRRFVLTCPSEKEQREWLESFRDVLSRPLTPLHLLGAPTESGCSNR